MLAKIRRIIAAVSLIMVTLLFVDFTGCAAAWLGWMAKIQFLPALLALNLVVVVALLLATFLFGRLYCSVICPLGIMQDLFGRAGKAARRNRYTYSRPLSWLRWLMLAVMAVALLAGVSAVFTLFAPYSAYGRIASSFLTPLWAWGNNLLAHWAEVHDSYAFYTVDVWLKGLAPMIVATITLVALGILAWRNGRTYCNTVCPVGTVLGIVSRFSVLCPVIDTSKCVGCNLCARNCKSACIDIKGGHTIDYSRCVVCFDCIDSCNKGAISYTARRSRTIDPRHAADTPADGSRRRFLGATAAVATAAALEARDKTVDGGLAAITDKKAPSRATRIVPPGAQSLRNVASHCTACQLCISACPNGVLRPSTNIATFMQPESSYERGYCRPECVRCSEVCPAGAIRLISVADKSAVQIGHAVWVKENCVVLTDGVECGNCARHCPVGAIQMVEADGGRHIPVVNADRCIGCGACENLCPARPFSAIYVEGHENHRTV